MLIDKYEKQILGLYTKNLNQKESRLELGKIIDEHNGMKTQMKAD